MSLTQKYIEHFVHSNKVADVSYEQKRAMRDDKRMNYYDRLQHNAQKERTRLNSAPTIKKCDSKGDIRHEAQVSTTKKLNFHTYSLNHSVVPRCDKI